MVRVLALLELVAGSGEHALVVRRTRSEAALLTMSACERAAVLRSCLFLGGVGLHWGQSGFIVRRVPITLGAKPVHLECRGDVLHEHRKRAQHSCQPKLRKLRGYQPSVRVFVPCHGGHYTPALAPVGSGGGYPTIFRSRALKSLAKNFGCPTNSVQAYPPPAVILGLVPRILVGCFGGIR